MMRGVRTVALGVFVAGIALAMSSAAAHAGARQDTAKPAAGKVDAAEVYKTRCQVCHAADGNSPMPNMSFADGKWLHGTTIAQVAATITNGVPSTAMMPFKAQLSKEEIAALARYVRKFDKKLK